MIINFSIKNFRSIKDKITLSFEPENSGALEDYYIIEPVPGLKLLKLGLIYGPNGSGKSTILKGLDFLMMLVKRPLQQKNTQLDFSPFLFDEKTPNEESGFEISFVHGGVKYNYLVNFTREAILYEKLEFYEPNKALVYERTTDREKQLSSIKFGGKIKVKKTAVDALEANTLWNTTVLSGFLKTNIDSTELKNVTDWFEKVLATTITPELDLSKFITPQLGKKKINKHHILQFLKKADFKISDLIVKKKELHVNEEMKELVKMFMRQVQKSGIEGDIDMDKLEKNELYFQHSIKSGDQISTYMLPYDEVSDGTQRYYQFSGILDIMIGHGSVFPIDELESSLHPDLVKHFLLLFLVNAKKSQLIATTHYRELLMEKDILRNDAIWFTEQKEDGSTDLFSLSDFDSSVVRDTTSVFNAYKSGKLGAVPVLSDYYLDFKDEKQQ
ncbi:AAA family ATPase [Chitinophaga barathri]|uniref:ATP-binding protein n=1 Tax=Chitinophaga barathri TaxID=1647451 RepID=A0A3N4MIT9_9BACT|nr:ATP-binding protein [Chitinophaga barathri]RPD41956.1 ATP-binding protein [Chitinophaga barathri]